MLAGAIVVFILAAKLMIPARTLLPYLFPYAALTIILAIALSLRVALVTTGLFVLVVGWLTGGSLELMAYALCGSLVGVLKVRRGERLGNFAWAALFVLVDQSAGRAGVPAGGRPLGCARADRAGHRGRH